MGGGGVLEVKETSRCRPTYWGRRPLLPGPRENYNIAKKKKSSRKSEKKAKKKRETMR